MAKRKSSLRPAIARLSRPISPLPARKSAAARPGGSARPTSSRHRFTVSSRAFCHRNDAGAVGHRSRGLRRPDLRGPTGRAVLPFWAGLWRACRPRHRHPTPTAWGGDRSSCHPRRLPGGRSFLGGDTGARRAGCPCRDARVRSSKPWTIARWLRSGPGDPPHQGQRPGRPGRAHHHRHGRDPGQ